MPRSRRCRAAILLSACLSVGIHLPCRAAIKTWQHDPATPGDWSTAANWSGGLPGSGDNACINNGGEAEFTTSSCEVYGLYLGQSSGDSGTLRLTGGEFTAIAEFIGAAGPGLFDHAGGTNTTGLLTIGTEGCYRLAGGSLHLSQGLDLQGTFEVAGPAALRIDSGMLNLASGSFLHSDRLSVTGGSSSLIVLPAGSDPASFFASFANEGITHVSGNTLAIPSGKSITASGIIRDHVNLSGQLQYLTGHSLSLTNGLTASGDARLSLGGGTLWVEDEISRLEGGSIDAATVHIGYARTGAFTQSKGIFRSSQLHLGYNPGSSGTYRLTDGTLAGLEHYVGYFGDGTLVQSGGAVNGYGYTQDPSLSLGYQPGSSGTYYLNDGTLVAASQWIGYWGTGTFIHSGGTSGRQPTSSYYDSGYLTLAYQPGSTGLYELSGNAQLRVSELRVGYEGAGTFRQSGGSNTIARTLRLADDFGSTGIYELSGGDLVNNGLYVGSGGIGTFLHTGGNNQVKGDLYLGTGSADYTSTTGQGIGTYRLSDNGQLSATRECLLNTSLFDQRGGSNNAAHLYIGPDARYLMSGGSLSITKGLALAGTLDFANQPSTLSAPSGIIDLSHGAVLNTSHLSFKGGDGALLILPAGSDPSRIFATLSNSGVTHVAGNTLTIPAGKSITGIGTIADHVDVAGTLTLSTSRVSSIYKPMSALTGGLTVRGGNVAIDGDIIINDTISGMSSGRISALNLEIGLADRGRFDQSGGTVALSSTLCLNGTSQHNATYILSGGELSAPAQYISASGGAILQQTGGSNSAKSVSIGSTGRYELAGGILNITEALSVEGQMDFANGAGTLSASSGLVDFSRGQLLNTAQASFVGGKDSLIILPQGSDPAQFGTWSTAGLTHIAGSTLAIPAGKGFTGTGTIGDHVQVAGSIAAKSYIHLTGGLTLLESGSVALGGGDLLSQGQPSRMSGGQLSASSQYVGKTADGSFIQTGGTNTISDGLYLGHGAGTSGTYRLEAGQLSAQSSEYIGYDGTGLFQQTGGQHTYSSIDLGCHSGSSGTYLLEDGTAKGSNCDVGDSSHGEFTQSGGTHSTGTLRVGISPDVTGTYRLSSGHLTVSDYQYLGYWGDGTFIHSGGSSTTSKSIYLGYSSGSSGAYQLSGDATLRCGSLFVGQGGRGSFAQSGGENTVSGHLYLGNDASSTGTYHLSGGTLEAAREYIGGSAASGLFQQSGGSNTVGYLSVGPNGQYQMSGGTLVISRGVDNSGIIDFAAGSPALSLTGGILNIAHGTYRNLDHLSVQGSGSALIILPAGTDPASLFAGFSNAGLTHIAGSTLAIPGDKTIAGAGDIDDHVDVSGSLAADTGLAIHLNQGLTLRRSASVNLGIGDLTVENTLSGMEGGQLKAANQYVGRTATGVFRQSGGTVTISNDLRLGADPNSSGTYHLSGGQLSAKTQSIGSEGAALFRQTGGTNTVESLSIGADGVYQLAGGRLRVTSSLHADGTLDFAGASTSLAFGNALVDLGHAAIANSSQAALTLGPDSLLILPPDFDPAAQFKQFSNQGLTRTAGLLNFAAGESFSTNGRIDYPVRCAGSITTPFNGALSLTGGIQVAGKGYVDLGVGTVTVRDTTSGISGGRLKAQTMDLAASTAPARFTQTGGNLTLYDLFVGGESGGAGTYTLEGGSVKLGDERYYQGGLTIHQGTVDLRGGMLDAQRVIVGSSINRPALLALHKGALLKVGNSLHANPGGTIQLDSDTFWPAVSRIGLDGGTLKAQGTFTGSLTLRGGTIDVPAGNLNVLKSITLDAKTSNTKTGSGSLIVNAAPAAGAGASLRVAEGSVIFKSFYNEKLALTVARGASADFTAGQHLAALTLESGAKAGLGAGGRMLKTKSLSLAGAPGAWEATLDLADGGLILESAPGRVAADLNQVASQIQSASSGPERWRGSGITSSSAADNPLTGLALLLNDRGDGTPLFTTFDGYSVDASTILVKHTWNGDTDLNGVIDADDYFRIDQGFLKHLGGYRHGDLDYSGTIDADDYHLIDSAFLAQGGILSAPPIGAYAVVPEPGTLTLLALGAASLMLPRHRRRQARR